MNSPLPTEEDLRTRVLVPYLRALGIDAGQLRLEKSFHLRLGTVAVEINGERKKDELRGRLDLLAQNADGENLFVVEVKAEGEGLTEADRDQGISYARLLDQIAPFVLLTNGRESRIYDTITKQELTSDGFPADSEFYSGGRALVSTEGIRIRYEALRHFLGYSSDNVRAFSHAQLAVRMKGLRGSPGDRSKKYIPHLYVDRREPEGEIERFLQGDGGVLAVVGESGVGKTNILCNLADRLSENHITLFFAGRDLYTDVADALVHEFNWHFSEQVEAPELLRRLDDLSQRTNRPVVIILDGLDECGFPQIEESTGDFAMRIASMRGSVKLVVSVKDVEWRRFAESRGDPSPLLLSLYHSSVDASVGDPGEPVPLRLQPFSPSELTRAVEVYTTFFNLHSEPQGKLREDCRVPFLLRVVGEVYEGASRQIPEDVGEADLLRAWLERKLTATGSRESALSELVAVAKGIFHYAQQPVSRSEPLSARERVPESIVREMSGIPAGQRVAEQLLAHGVLVAQDDEEGRRSFSFYYGRLRDYVIARHVLRLDQRTDEEFREILPVLLSSFVLQGVLFWHLENATAGHREVLKELLAGRAAEFVEVYERILDRLVPGVKRYVEPETSGRIGIACWFDSYGLARWGFFPLGTGAQERVLEIVPVNDGRPDAFSRELWRIGGTTARGGGKNFANTDPTEAASRFAAERLVEAVEQGRLSEVGSSDLVDEAILALAAEYRKDLDLPKPVSLQHRFIGPVPLDLRDLMARLHTHFGKEFLRREWADEQVAQGTRWVRRVSERSYTITYDPEVVEQLAQQAADEARRGRRFPAPNIVGQEDQQVFADLLEKRAGERSRIQEPVLPPPDISPPYRDYRVHWAYSDGQLKALLEDLFQKAMYAYTVLVDENLPGLRPRLRRYQGMPYLAVISYHRPHRGDDKQDWGTVTYALLPDMSQIAAQAHVDPEFPVFRLNGREWEVYVNGDYAPAPGWRTTSLQSLLLPHNAPGFRSRGGHGASGHCPIRALTYRLIKEDIEDVGHEELLATLQGA